MPSNIHVLYKLRFSRANEQIEELLRAQLTFGISSLLCSHSALLTSTCQQCKLFSQVIPQFISQDFQLSGGYSDVLRLQVSDLFSQKFD